MKSKRIPLWVHNSNSLMPNLARLVRMNCLKARRPLNSTNDSSTQRSLVSIKFTQCVSAQKSAFSPLQEKLCVGSKNDWHLLELSWRSLSACKVRGRSNYRVAQIKIPHRTKCNFSTTIWDFYTQISWFIWERSCYNSDFF